MEQACRRGYRENATKPKASSTRQSDCRVRLPTVTHTTKKDATVLLPPFTNNLNLLYCLEQWICSVQPQNAELICVTTGHMTFVISDDMFYVYSITCRSHSFGTICQHFENIHSQSHPLIYLCGEGQHCCDAKPSASAKIISLKKRKQLYSLHCGMLLMALTTPADNTGENNTMFYILMSALFLFFVLQRNVRWSGITIKPWTAEVNIVDRLAIVQCSDFVLALMWMLSTH